MKSFSLLSPSRSWYFAILTICILQCAKRSTAEQSQYTYITNEDYSDFTIDPYLRLKITGKGSSNPLSDEAKSDIVAAVTDVATESMKKFFIDKYPPDEDGDREYAFDMVVFNVISTNEFSVEQSANTDSTRARRTLRVFEREEAEIQLEMLKVRNILNGSTHPSRLRVQRGLEEDERYGTSLDFNGTLSYEYVTAPPEVSQEALLDFMGRKTKLYDALRDRIHSLLELENLENEADLKWEFLTPEPTTSPFPTIAPSSSPSRQPTQRPTLIPTIHLSQSPSGTRSPPPPPGTNLAIGFIVVFFSAVSICLMRAGKYVFCRYRPCCTYGFLGRRRDAKQFDGDDENDDDDRDENYPEVVHTFPIPRLPRSPFQNNGYSEFGIEGIDNADEMINHNDDDDARNYEGINGDEEMNNFLVGSQQNSVVKSASPLRKMNIGRYDIPPPPRDSGDALAVEGGQTSN